MRTEMRSRLYLQVPNGSRADDWTDERIWSELSCRFEIDADWKLDQGPIRSKGVVSMYSTVTEPMRYGRLLLAGDAAHIVPPTGAKGLNLAVADAVVAARAIGEFCSTGSSALIDSYSDTCLRRVWRAEHFSWFMTSMLHLPPGSDGFDRRLQIAQLERIAASGAAASEFADNYVGSPIT